MPTTSWIIRRKDTQEVICETYDRHKIRLINTEKYEAVEVQEYLGESNKQVKKGSVA